MAAVAAAPARPACTAFAHAAAAVCPASGALAKATAEGRSASSIVRSPGFAPPSSAIDSTAAARARDQSSGVGEIGRPRAARSSAVAYARTRLGTSWAVAGQATGRSPDGSRRFRWSPNIARGIVRGGPGPSAPPLLEPIAVTSSPIVRPVAETVAAMVAEHLPCGRDGLHYVRVIVRERRAPRPMTSTIRSELRWLS